MQLIGAAAVVNRSAEASFEGSEKWCRKEQSTAGRRTLAADTRPVARPFSLAFNRPLHFNVVPGFGQTASLIDQILPAKFSRSRRISNICRPAIVGSKRHTDNHSTCTGPPSSFHAK